MFTWGEVNWKTLPLTKFLSRDYHSKKFFFCRKNLCQIYVALQGFNEWRNIPDIFTLESLYETKFIWSQKPKATKAMLSLLQHLASTHFLSFQICPRLTLCHFFSIASCLFLWRTRSSKNDPTLTSLLFLSGCSLDCFRKLFFLLLILAAVFNDKRLFIPARLTQLLLLTTSTLSWMNTHCTPPIYK